MKEYLDAVNAENRDFESDIDTLADHNIELQSQLAAANAQLEAMRKG